MHPGNNLTRDEARRRAQLIQTPLYDISLDLTRDTDTFACEATIHFLCQEPGADSFIDFLVPSVDSCELNGEEVPKDAFNGARITLSNLRDANELHVLATCDYQNIGAGLNRFKDPVDHKVYLHSQFETFDAHRMFPCFDQPDLKASFTFTVLAPSDWVVVSNNAGQAQTVTGKENIKRWTFGATPKMSTASESRAGADASRLSAPAPVVPSRCRSGWLSCSSARQLRHSRHGWRTGSGSRHRSAAAMSFASVLLPAPVGPVSSSACGMPPRSIARAAATAAGWPRVRKPSAGCATSARVGSAVRRPARPFVSSSVASAPRSPPRRLRPPMAWPSRWSGCRSA